MVLLDAARRDIKAPRLAYWLLGVGITVTLVANVLAGVAFGVLGAVVAAWPALALVGSYELLMIMIRRARTAPEVVADDVPVPAPVDTARTVAPIVPGAVPTTPAPEVGQAVTRKRTRRLTPEQRAERKYAGHIADGQVPSLRAIMGDLHLGQPRAREVRQHLASLATASGTVSHG